MDQIADFEPLHEKGGDVKLGGRGDRRGGRSAQSLE